MKPTIQTLGQILYSPSQYVIPVFQRNYRWEAPQWSKLWESLTEIQRPEKSGNHFMGFLVLVPGLPQPGQNTTFHMIDGQQRLTTLSILLAAVRNVARKEGQPELADEIHQDYLVHPRKKGDQHYRLLPKERDHDSYLALVDQNGRPTGRIADALAFFEEKLTNDGPRGADYLRRVFNTVCQRLEFMCATLERENAYNIFKSLNSTGIPLGPSDLIRNFVFMHVQPEDQEEFDRTLWSPLEQRFVREDGTLDESRFSAFFRDYLMSHGRYLSPKDTFATFEARYEATAFVPQELAKTLLANADHYSVITGRAPDADSVVDRAIKGLNVLESATTYPLLLELFRRRVAGALDSPGLANCIEMLRGFIFRRYVCGESSRGYGYMFVRACGIESADSPRSLEKYLLERGWPSDGRFEEAFVQFPFYLGDYAREMLETLERARGHKEPADLAAVTVEHVMPQTLNDAWKAALGPGAQAIHEEWLHRAGNLTLSAYNQELWNHPFPTKRERYAQSNVVLTRELANFTQWTEVEIQDRGRALAREAAAIWIGPVGQPVQPAIPNGDDEDSPDRLELRRRFWTALREHLAVDHPELPDFEPRGNWTIRLPSGLRYVAIEIRFALRQKLVAIDVLFGRAESFCLWERIRQAPEVWNELAGESWSFGQLDGQPHAWMSLSLYAPNLRNETSWSEVFPWFAQRLSRVYGAVIPRLREEMEEVESA